MPGTGNPKITFRVDLHTRSQLKILAKEMGYSLSELLREIIYAYLGGE